MTIKALTPLTGYQGFAGPVVVIIMDGVGIGSRDEKDGVYQANTPVLDALFTEPLMVTLKAHGQAVGLPTDGDMGNSEVGHNALGAGRVFARRVRNWSTKPFSQELFLAGEAWQKILANVAGPVGQSTSLASSPTATSIAISTSSLLLLDRCAAERFARVRVHALLDGRDVDQKSALQYLEALEEKLADLSADGRDYRIASGGGRMVTTMDRYNADWKVVENGWKAHVLGVGRSFCLVLRRQ